MHVTTPSHPPILACLLTLCFLISSRAEDSRHTDPAQFSEARPVQVVMNNVMYHYTGQAAVHIVKLQGELLPSKAGEIVAFDDKNSFVLALTSAQVSIGCDSLAQALNQNVFSSADAPIKSLSIESKNDRLTVRGKFHQKGDVAFEMTASVSANGDGRIRLHSEHLKAGHLPVKGIMDLLGLDLARLINTNKVAGISVDKDDILIDPQQVLPPPHIKAKVTAVQLQGNDIVQIFGSSQPSGFERRQSGNFIALRGGEVRFGKLTMRDADVVLVDMDQRDALDFYIDHYQEQLVAGYTKTTPELGLRVYLRDYGKLKSGASTQRIASR